MAQVLLIDQRRKARLLALRAYAEANPVTSDKVKLMAEGKLPPVGDSGLFQAEIPLGYRVVFSIEEQPAGLCRHLSLSVAKHGCLPNPRAIEELMGYLGFRGGIQKCKVWLEHKHAINVLQPLQGGLQ
jgi:hypothetical protein